MIAHDMAMTMGTAEGLELEAVVPVNPPTEANEIRGTTSMEKSATTGEAATHPAGLIDELLRHPALLIERIEAGEGLMTLARTLLLSIAVCAAGFGLAIGLYRGGVQVLYASIKFPAVLLLTAVLCAPAFSALKISVQQPGALRKDFALVLASLALSCLVLAALTPLVLLAVCIEVDYHDLIMLIVGCCALSGLVGGGLFVRGLMRQMDRGRLVVAMALLAVLGLVSAQASWTLRPYVVRPRTPDVPFVRGLEDNIFAAVLTSSRSMRGLYERSAAPLPGEAHDDEAGAVGAGEPAARSLETGERP